MTCNFVSSNVWLILDYSTDKKQTAEDKVKRVTDLLAEDAA